MKRKIVLILLVVTAVIFFSSCPSPLTSNLPADLVLILGRFNAGTAVTNIRGAVGGTIELPVLISNLMGGTASGSYEVAFTLSQDPDLDTTGDNTAVATVTVTAGSETMVTLNVPAAITVAGNYSLFGVMAATDAAANNNTASIVVAIGANNLPDLEISLGTTPGWVEPGSTMNIPYRIENAGFAKVASGTSFNVECTADISAATETMADVTLTLAADLHPQDVVTGAIAVGVPTLEQMAADDGVSTTDLGIWSDGVITVNIDTGDTVTEITEGGTTSFTITSGNRWPDFVMNDIIMPAGFQAAKIGGPVELTLEIMNNGRAASGDYGIDLYIDVGGTTGVYDEGTDKMLKQWTTAETPVAPYDSAGAGNNVVYINTLDLSLTYPTVAENTPYDIRAEITTDEDEYNAGNNDATEAGVTFYENLVDLSMKGMTSTLASGIDAATGGAIPVTYVIRNSGDDDFTGDFDVSFYVTDDATINTATDVAVGTDTLTGVTIPGGGSVSRSYSATFPDTESAGFYTLYWVIDPASALSETDDSNNQPADVEDCYVFPVVTETGVTTLSIRLLAYKPWGAQDRTTYAAVNLYDASWNTYFSASNWISTPGTLYVSRQDNITTGETAGVSVHTYYSDVPVAFRLVPNYVNGLPENAIPSALFSQDGYETNNSQSLARELTGTHNPLFGFVNVWIDDDADPDDYFTFQVP